MFRQFLSLEWKSFTRSSAFGANIVVKIFLALFAIYFSVMFSLIGCLLYSIIDEAGMNPLQTVNRYLMYYLIGDLCLRYMLQKMPIVNIKPMMVLPVKRNTIVHFALGKTVVSFFNLIHLFVLIPFTVSLLIHGGNIGHVLLWHVSILALLLSNNFLNILINNRDRILFPVAAVVALLIAGQYSNWFDVTQYTGVFFNLFSETWFAFLLPIVLLAFVHRAAFLYFRDRMYLDTGMAVQKTVARTENFGWLDQFGKLGTFLKNDIRLIKRNKRSLRTVMASVVFIFYGLLFITNAVEVYRSPNFLVFVGIMVSGGFLLTFGQLVPSWDSAYYPLMMSQNITYKDYLASKWWLMVIATIVSTVIASFYLAISWQFYFFVLAGAAYNIGINSYVVLLGGAFVRTPVDLTAAKRAFGDKQAFNPKNLLIALPKMLFPVLLYLGGNYFGGTQAGLITIAVVGLAGLLFRNKMFGVIERIYRKEKYATLEAFKEKN